MVGNSGYVSAVNLPVLSKLFANMLINSHALSTLTGEKLGSPSRFQLQEIKGTVFVWFTSTFKSRLLLIYVCQYD